MLVTLFNTLALELQAYQEHSVDELVLTARGDALNRTSYTEGKIRLSITALRSGQLQGLFEWDNILLYGKAITCGEVVAKNDEGVKISFKGTFDCSNVGGWPKDTFSDFEASIKWFKNTGEVKGAYRILGKGNLPEQFGTFELASLRKSKSRKGHIEDACGSVEIENNSKIDLFVDFKNGTLNGARPDFTEEQFQLLFPKFVDELVWSDIPSLHGIEINYFSNYFIIEKEFGIDTSIKLFGKSRKRTLSRLGDPAKSGEMYDAFQMEYGTLIVFYADTIHDFISNRKKKKRVKWVSIHNTSLENAINALCDDPEVCR